jgi:dihydrofolate synthase/folylpolyglutamate synthase
LTYGEAVSALYALGNEVRTARLGLARIGAVLARLGDPQQACRFVHVAGTNGKGSVCAMVEAGLRAAGVRTGLYTSPHLVEPLERIQIAGRPVSSQAFADAYAFESVSARACLLFRDEGANLVVLEVGLGGRLDATNVVNPELCVITRIDTDHQRFLGNTIEEIAAEKAGILKRGVPAVIARQDARAQQVIERHAAEVGAPLLRTQDELPENIRIDRDGSSFRLDGRELRCPLAGEHQIENAVAAAVALRCLGSPIEGIAQARWPGRMERVARQPEIILDGAHNPGGVRALAAYIQRFYSGRRIWLVFGAMSDKSPEESAAVLFPLAHRIIATAPDNARALAPEAIHGTDVTHAVAEAVELVRRHTPPTDVVFITGSLFVVGEARRILIPADYVE